MRAGLSLGIETEYELVLRLLLRFDSSKQDEGTLRTLNWNARRAAMLLSHYAVNERKVLLQDDNQSIIFYEKLS